MGRSKLYPVSVDPREHGAAANGTTNDAAAWLTTREVVRVAGGDLFLPPGTHRVDGLQWAKGIRNARISGYGAKVFNGKADGADIDGQPFWSNGSPFNSDGWGSLNLGAGLTFGYLINTTTPGTGTVTTTTHGDAAHFAAGDWVLVYGYAGWGASLPPWPRHFEFARVISAVAATGVVTLDRYLADQYRADWYDFTPTWGATTYHLGQARILNLTRTDYQWADHLTIEGIEFLANPNHAAAAYNGACYFTGADRITVRDCKIPYCVPTVAGDVVFDHCDIGLVELDKIVRSVTFRGCNVGVGPYQDPGTAPGGFTHGIANGNSLKRVTFEDCRIYGAVHNIAALQSTYRGCDIYSTTPRFRGGGLAGYVALLNGYSNWPGRVRLEDCYVAQPTAIAGVTDGGDMGGCKVAAAPAPTATTCALSHAWDLSTAAWVAIADDASAQLVLSNLCAGMRIRTATGKTCLVQAVTWDAVNSCLVVTGEFSATAAGAEEWHWCTLDGVEIIRPRKLGADADKAGKLIVAPATRRVLTGSEEEFQRFVWTERDFPRFAGGTGGYAAFVPRIDGKIVRLTIDVQKAYAGASPDCNLYFDQVGGAGTRIAVVNALTAGVRICDFAAVAGAVAGDTLVPAAGLAMQTASAIIMTPTGPPAWSFPAWAALGELPIFTITAEVMHFR